MMRCRDDLTALARFVAWDMHERSSGALKRSLPDQNDIISLYRVAAEAAGSSKASSKEIEGNSGKNTNNSSSNSSSNNKERESKVGSKSKSGELKPVIEIGANVERDYQNLLQLMEEVACSRQLGRTNMVIGGLVQHIVAQ